MLCVCTATEQLGGSGTWSFTLLMGCRALLGCQFLWTILGLWQHAGADAQPGERVTFTTSGWQENGFDWNRIPGATSIHLPFDQLRAKVLNVDAFSGMEEMLYSDEAFAGGLSQEREMELWYEVDTNMISTTVRTVRGFRIILWKYHRSSWL